MPPTIFRIAFSAILVLLVSTSIATAQSGADPCSTGQASDCHTISFRFGEYDVISSIYVFLTSGTQQTTCELEIISIQRRSGLGWLLPQPISLDLLFRAAIRTHQQQGDLPCAGSGESIPFYAALANSEALTSVIFSLFSLLHLSDQWAYSVQCEEEDILIVFSEFIDELLFD